MLNLENNIEKVISQNGMEKIYDGCIVGFSGGADSSALVHYLKDRCKNLLCVHINHMIRGAEADRDMELCKDVCAEYGVKLLTFLVDIPRLCKERRQGTEETARQERYRIFYEILESNPEYKCIATAHNLNDNAETVIFNLARGSGITGVGGIKPVSGDVYRPLIETSREQILEYCQRNKIRFVEDSTNSTDEYTRNRIRHNIIPMLTEINAGFLDSVLRFTRLLRQDEEYIDSECEKIIAQSGASSRIGTELLLSLHPSLSLRLLRKICPVRLDYKASQSCMELVLSQGVGKWLCIGGGYCFKVERGYCTFVRQDKIECSDFEYPLDKDINYINEADITLTVNNELKSPEYEMSCLIKLNEKEIFGDLYVRSRKDGDTVRCGKMTKKLKRLLCDSHIPSHERSRIPLICDSLGIVAVPGVCVRDGAKNGKIEIRLYKKRN